MSDISDDNFYTQRNIVIINSKLSALRIFKNITDRYIIIGKFQFFSISWEERRNWDKNDSISATDIIA